MASGQPKDSPKPVPPVTTQAPNASDAKQSTAGKQEITVNLPSAINLNISGSANIKTQSEQKAADAETNKWVDPANVVALLLFFATASLVWYARDTARTQLRAYVSFRPKVPIQFPTLDQWHTNGMIFLVSNDGQTPADGLIHTTRMAIRNVQAPNLEPITVQQTGGSFVVNPGMFSEIKMVLPQALSEQERDALIHGRTGIYIWGEVHYRDRFQWFFQGPRSTRYAMLYKGDGGPSSSINWLTEGNQST
jgi:hypothetical protein